MADEHESKEPGLRGTIEELRAEVEKLAKAVKDFASDHQKAGGSLDNYVGKLKDVAGTVEQRIRDIAKKL